MSKNALAGISNVKKTNAAVMRTMYGNIVALLNDGYSHKQICEHLNSEGFVINYPQYTVIISRLRRENETSPSIQSSPKQEETKSSSLHLPSPISSSALLWEDAPVIEPEKKYLFGTPVLTLNGNDKGF